MTGNPSRIIVYGTTWCPDCIRVIRFLKGKKIDYDWIDISRDDEARQRVMDINDGNRSVPTIIFPDDDILVEPSTKNLKKKIKSLEK
jgi:mycoredoxin